MTEGKTLSPELRGLLILADEVAQAHGIPLEEVLIQTLANASALAADLVTSKPAGEAVPARFSILVRTPDHQCPLWMADEVNHLLDRQDQMVHAGDKLGSVSALRRRKRVLEYLGAVNDREIRGPGGLDFQIAMAKRRPFFHFIQRVGRGKPPVSVPGNHRLTRWALGPSDLRKVLALKLPQNESWQSATGAQAHPSVLGWISTDEWGSLIKGVPACHFPRLGWILNCAGSNYRPDLDVAPRLLAPLVLQRLEIARLCDNRFAFVASEVAKALLDRHVEQFREMAAAAPASIRDHVLPDAFLAWHLTALLVSFCGYGTGEDFLESEIQCTRVAVALATWIAVGHVHDFRQSFPADDEGELFGNNLSLFRFLTDLPAAVRSFQRRLRGVDSRSCLRSLHHLVSAGLAVNCGRDRFSAVPRPGPSHGLSDFLSEFDPLKLFPVRCAAISTDSTDRKPLSPSLARTSHGGSALAPETTPNQNNNYNERDKPN